MKRGVKLKKNVIKNGKATSFSECLFINVHSANYD